MIVFLHLKYIYIFFQIEIFPELCVPECVPVEVLYPINKPSLPSSDNTATAGNDNNKQVPQVARRNEANQQGPLVGGIIQQRRPNNRENSLRGIVAAHAENANNNPARANGSNNPQGNTTNNNNNNVAGQRGIFDQWRKWIIVSLVCLYLVITKLLARSTSGSPGVEPGM
jgi:hypothetical protein